MARVKRIGGVQIRSTPVTFTPKSAMDGLIGLAGDVVDFVGALKGISDRRKDERLATQAHQRNTRLLSVRKGLIDARLGSSGQMSEYDAVASKLIEDEMAWGEAQGWEPEVLSRYALDLNNLDGPHRNALLARAEEQQLTERLNDELEVSATRFGDMEAAGRTFANGLYENDQAQIREGIGALQAMQSGTEDPDGAMLGSAGPEVATILQIRQQKQWDTGAMHAMLDQAHQAGNLGDVIVDIENGGIALPPDRDGNVRVLGATMDAPELRQVVASWTRARQAADRAYGRAEGDAGDDDEAHDEELGMGWLRRYAATGEPPTADELSKLRTVKEAKWWTLKVGDMAAEESPSQQRVWAQTEPSLKQSLAGIDPAAPARWARSRRSASACARAWGCTSGAARRRSGRSPSASRRSASTTASRPACSSRCRTRRSGRASRIGWGSCPSGAASTPSRRTSRRG